MTHAQTPSGFSRRYRLVFLGAFLVLVIGMGAFIGAQSVPGPWFAALEKPPFNPPNWVFAPVWFTLYVLIAFAGWRIFLKAPVSGTMALWAGQMIANWTWSPVFFTLHNLWLALLVILLLLGLIVGFIIAASRKDKLAAWLFAPYALWVTFATLLNGAIALMN
ncbi:TspO/MBR family protein [Pelagibacterium xiamenense]|uniref:TspO/MBR family protein n=1 Tax=Pelagibacterium xiamenense TaxID=2901140 RepID=UPI001E43BBC9|nr:TspO/MBR family protein [Pelagibacterium xiamenense]MCD7059693.1 tryptophan-rich sensory protein [Pelagibacterium xiamenense]